MPDAAPEETRGLHADEIAFAEARRLTMADIERAMPLIARLSGRWMVTVSSDTLEALREAERTYERRRRTPWWRAWWWLRARWEDATARDID